MAHYTKSSLPWNVILKAQFDKSSQAGMYTYDYSSPLMTNNRALFVYKLDHCKISVKWF